MISKSVRNFATIAIAGGVLLGVFLSPAGAHVSSAPAHLYNQHLKSQISGDFYTKRAANQRFVRLRQGAHVYNGAVTNDTPQLITAGSATPADLGTLVVTVPAGQTWYVISELTAESVCSGTSGYCVVDVIVDNGAVDSHPSSGNDFAFDSTEAGSATSQRWKSLTMRRVSDVLTAGSHTIQFIGYVEGTGTFRVDDMLASVDSYLVG